MFVYEQLIVIKSRIQSADELQRDNIITQTNDRAMRNLKPYFTSLLILTTQLLQLSSSSAVRTGVEEVQELLNLGDGIDFHGASQYTILMGSSGVGKSTLAKFLIQDPTLTHHHAEIENPPTKLLQRQ
ncbi:Hypothetical predicted protein [Cloeon dipterum]|uniref:Uncharacterized protein n=1 Tax=Cloeon dipterum TaxID=197152 RepID=A0A8S1CC58_9INSE|nr:Hypothetical predicted protein [Cloeon dipterum]